MTDNRRGFDSPQLHAGRAHCPAQDAARKRKALTYSVYVNAMTMPPFPVTIAHVALTVSDLERSIEWYTALFATPPAHVGEMLRGTSHHYSLAVWREPNLGLHHFADAVAARFDERRPGLDHLAFACANTDELHAWTAHLDRLGIERGDILVEPYGSGLAFRDPDNIALEFFVPRARTKLQTSRPPDQALAQ